MYVERFRGNLGQVKLLGIKKAKDLNNLQKTRNKCTLLLTISKTKSDVNYISYIKMEVTFNTSVLLILNA